MIEGGTQKGGTMSERISFNVNVELYENDLGELALRFPDKKVYRITGDQAEFVRQAVDLLKTGRHADDLQEMPAHQLLYGRGWHCITRLGFLGGDEDRPAVEFEGDPEGFGPQAKA
jgi:hypothetical protein